MHVCTHTRTQTHNTTHGITQGSLQTLQPGAEARTSSTCLGLKWDPYKMMLQGQLQGGQRNWKTMKVPERSHQNGSCGRWGVTGQGKKEVVAWDQDKLYLGYRKLEYVFNTRTRSQSKVEVEMGHHWGDTEGEGTAGKTQRKGLAW